MKEQERQAALDALDRMYNDALASQDGYGTTHDDFDTIRAALTAPDVNAELQRRYDDLEYSFSCFLEIATGGKLSKTNCDLGTMRSAFKEYLDDERQEAYNEGVKAEIDHDIMEELQIIADGGYVRNEKLSKERGMDMWTSDPKYIARQAISRCSIGKENSHCPYTIKDDLLMTLRDLWLVTDQSKLTADFRDKVFYTIARAEAQKVRG